MAAVGAIGLIAMLLLTFLCVEHWVRLPVLALILTHIRR
jgi:hypothetical protein